jgi:hypothetical protein
MFKLFIILFFLIYSSNNFPQRELDFEDKNLKHEIQKISGTESTDLIEFHVNTGSIQGKFFTFSDQNNSKKYLYVGRVNSCRAGGCSNPALPASGLETSEYFDYFVVFDGNLSIQQVKVYNYQATHGQEVTNKGWLKQFQGYNGERQLNVGKNIDAISGATVSVYAITNDIQEKTQLLKKIVEVRN